MKKTFNILWLFSLFSIKTTFQNKFGIVLFMLAKVIRFGMYFFFVYNLMVHTKLLAGYSINQTLIFFLTFNLIDTLTQLIFREVYRFRPLVVSGELDAILIKPYHPFLRILTGGLDIMDLLLVIPYIGLLIYFGHQLGGITLSHGLLFVLLIINAIILGAAFHIGVLALGLLTTEIDHTMLIYRDITRMAAFPLDIYKDPLRSILTFVIPVGIMMSVPAKALLGTLSPSFVSISFAFAAVFMTGALLFWNYAIKKYQSWGS